MATISLTTLMTIGNEWIKGDYHRIYFNDQISLMQVSGFKVSTYKSGSISSAFDADGDKISNSKATKLYFQLTKCFYDVKTGKFSVENEVTKNIKIITETKKDKKAVMTRAWIISKEAQAKFGGKASQYLSGALKAAWAE